jgi:hypothetical protein
MTAEEFYKFLLNSRTDRICMKNSHMLYVTHYYADKSEQNSEGKYHLLYERVVYDIDLRPVTGLVDRKQAPGNLDTSIFSHSKGKLTIFNDSNNIAVGNQTVTEMKYLRDLCKPEIATDACLGITKLRVMNTYNNKTLVACYNPADAVQNSNGRISFTHVKCTPENTSK